MTGRSRSLLRVAVVGLKTAVAATALPAVILVGHTVAPLAETTASAAVVTQVQPASDSWSRNPYSTTQVIKPAPAKSLQVDSWS